MEIMAGHCFGWYGGRWQSRSDHHWNESIWFISPFFFHGQFLGWSANELDVVGNYLIKNPRNANFFMGAIKIACFLIHSAWEQLKEGFSYPPSPCNPSPKQGRLFWKSCIWRLPYCTFRTLVSVCVLCGRDGTPFTSHISHNRLPSPLCCGWLGNPLGHENETLKGSQRSDDQISTTNWKELHLAMKGPHHQLLSLLSHKPRSNPTLKLSCSQAEVGNVVQGF